MEENRRIYLSWEELTGEVDAMKVNDLFMWDCKIEEIDRCVDNVRTYCKRNDFKVKVFSHLTRIFIVRMA